MYPQHQPRSHAAHSILPFFTSHIFFVWAFAEFIYVSIGSISLGIMLGILVTMVLKHFEFKHFKEMVSKTSLF